MQATLSDAAVLAASDRISRPEPASDALKVAGLSDAPDIQPPRPGSTHSPGRSCGTFAIAETPFLGQGPGSGVQAPSGPALVSPQLHSTHRANSAYSFDSADSPVAADDLWRERWGSVQATGGSVPGRRDRAARTA